MTLLNAGFEFLRWIVLGLVLPGCLCLAVAILIGVVIISLKNASLAMKKPLEVGGHAFIALIAMLCVFCLCRFSWSFVLEFVANNIQSSK